MLGPPIAATAVQARSGVALVAIRRWAKHAGGNPAFRRAALSQTGFDGHRRDDLVSMVGSTRRRDCIGIVAGLAAFGDLWRDGDRASRRHLSHGTRLELHVSDESTAAGNARGAVSSISVRRRAPIDAKRTSRGKAPNEAPDRESGRMVKSSGRT